MWHCSARLKTEFGIAQPSSCITVYPCGRKLKVYKYTQPLMFWNVLNVPIGFGYRMKEKQKNRKKDFRLVGSGLTT